MNFVLIDGSYYVFYRYYALRVWWNKARGPDEPQEPSESERFIDKFRTTFVSNIKEIDTNQLVPSFSPFRANKREVKKTKTDKILYSALRKAIAPSEIFFAILSIFSEPTSLEATQLFLK